MANKIHHAQLRQAEQYGFTLEDKPPHVRAFHPATATQVFGVSAKDAIAQMLAVQNMYQKDDTIRYVASSETPNTGFLRRVNGDPHVTGGYHTPVELYRMYVAEELPWVNPDEEGGDEGLPDRDDYDADPGTQPLVSDTYDQFQPDPDPKPPVDDTPLIQRSEAGVPFDGAIAYKEGVMAADCPFEEGDERADLWFEQWDQAADDNTESEEDGKGGSVVKSRYRQIYKELGHPNHCGDWLADLLNNYCIGDKNTDTAMVERICNMNGVSLDKYNRATPGWQGRLRMTGRNLLARVVWKNKQVETPDGIKPAPADWLSAQRFKETS